MWVGRGLKSRGRGGIGSEARGSVGRARGRTRRGELRDAGREDGAGSDGDAPCASSQETVSETTRGTPPPLCLHASCTDAPNTGIAGVDRGRRDEAASGVVGDSETTRRNGRRSRREDRASRARGSTARGERRETRARASALEYRATRTRARGRDVRRARDGDSRRRRRARVSEIGGKRGPRMRFRVVSYEKTVSLKRGREKRAKVSSSSIESMDRYRGITDDDSHLEESWSSPISSRRSALPPLARGAR